MMRFSAQRSRAAWSDSSTIPLINVVFLMLIFLLVAGTLRQFDHAGIVPPAAERDPQGGIAADRVIHVHADGRAVFRGEMLEAGLIAARLSAEAGGEEPGTVWMMADRELGAADGIRILRTLKAAGLADVRLVVRSGGGS